MSETLEEPKLDRILSVTVNTPEEALQLIRDHHTEVYKLAGSIFYKSPHLEDLQQDFYVHLLENAIPKYNGSVKLSTFIYACARYFYWNHIQSRQLTKNQVQNIQSESQDYVFNGQIEGSLVSSGNYSSSSARSNPLNNMILDESLERMPTNLKTIVKGYFFEGRDMVELTQELGMSVSNGYKIFGDWQKSVESVKNG